ncbi:sigma-54-dependent Fis family transcriptional regulator [Microlunatus speluncae]|uniref:sigma-54-dependent Fis family transcriptional regulator n=1 Tax=Microlunatus speluncae TaxID=2594267 RepID=UPI001C2D4DF5|nr:helix-turn-helix domain-containing protein [Microlunatus speluncae]
MDEQLAAARLRFLTAEPVHPREVRHTILASWKRSRHWNLPADRIELPYIADPDLELPLARSADPVLQRLHDHLDGQPISVILTDRTGMVLTRLTADGRLSQHLDKVKLAPGFSYAEQFAGTNGIGTALEGGRPMHVFGHEHYAEDLEDLACAGVPIKHPISGKTVGAVDLTCWRKDAGSLLIALAKTTADQIRTALLNDTSARELELLQVYLQASRRSGEMVIAIDRDLVLMNDSARQVLDSADQPMLLRHATELLAGGRRAPTLIELPSGRRVRISCRPVNPDRPGGGIVQLTPLPVEPARPAQSREPARPILPGVVGTGPLWLGSCRAVDRAYRAGEWLVLSGEPGVGKLALARAANQLNHPATPFPVVDAATTAEGWIADLEAELLDDTVRALAIRHVDRLDPSQLEELVGVLDTAREQRAGSLWVAVTLTPGSSTEPDLTSLLTLFPLTVDVPPLRHHIEDLRRLVPFFLGRLGRGGELTCSPEALQQLSRSTWPGNTGELYQVLKQVVRHRRRQGAILASELPADHQAISRRQLTQLESLERDAIVQSLADSNGNKDKAARSLGMSRATIYRKIHEYGIRAPR